MSYTFRLFQYDDVRADVSLLDAAELSRASRMRDDLAERFTKRRTALRTLLGATTDPILVRPSGRPYVADGPDFSISTSGDYFAIAFGPSIGIDLECVRAFDYRPLLLDHFTARERVEIGDEITFFRAWTLKEAVAKADGQGIGESLARFEIVAGSIAGFRVDSFEPVPGVVAAVALMLTSGHEDPTDR